LNPSVANEQTTLLLNHLGNISLLKERGIQISGESRKRQQKLDKPRGKSTIAPEKQNAGDLL
jgi:hypothetical protein